jgi:endo-1,4-beta-xylanase
MKTNLLSDEKINEQIEKNRTAEVTLTINGGDGRPLSNESVNIRQVRHKFLFGCNAFGLRGPAEDARWREYRRRFLDVFNYATLPFYWGRFEPEEGKPITAQLKTMAQWCVEHNIKVKGHPLCWHTATAMWLKGRSPEEIYERQLARIEREMKDFAGIVDIWDVINEVVIMPEFDEPENPIVRLSRHFGRVELVKRVFVKARQVNPKATLLLNDDNISADYERLIENCLDAGIEIDVIGLQSHMHQGNWSPEQTQDVLERFSRFGKPLHFTEISVVSGEIRTGLNYRHKYDDWPNRPECEQIQNKVVVEFYKQLFSHPSVEAITWWDLQDGMWLGAPSGLLRNDMTPKPSYNSVKKLVKEEWWTGPLQLRTDDAGSVSFHGFLGQYVVESGKRTGSVFIEKAGHTETSVNLVSH